MIDFINNTVNGEVNINTHNNNIVNNNNNTGVDINKIR